MNWAIPSAPAGLRAVGSKPDSTWICAASSAAPTLQRCAERDSGARNCAGTNAGIALLPPSAGLP